MNANREIARLCLFPLTARESRGRLEIGGCDTTELAREFGTPLYVFDELTLRRKCAEFRDEFTQRYPDTNVLYASKAFINRTLARILAEEGLGLDVVSAGEMGIASAAGFPPERVYFHGNNKSAAELQLALERGIGRIVVDNFHELSLLSRLADERKAAPEILLRFTPGIDPHTHKYITTGTVDSKFGFPLTAIEQAVAEAARGPWKLLGLHYHLGSLIHETEPFRQGVELALELAADLRKKHGFILKELNIGGGFAIRYTLDSPDTPVSAYAETIIPTLNAACRRLDLEPPRLVIEPGRAIVGQAAAALYTVGAVKDIPGVRRYVSVDGGMGDNIRPAIYGSVYEALAANRVLEESSEKVTVCGRYCESGDILIRDILLPPLSAGDIVAIPDCGAYCIPMASNYNASTRPAIVMVKDGQARLIRRRETTEDLLRCDI